MEFRTGLSLFQIPDWIGSELRKPITEKEDKRLKWFCNHGAFFNDSCEAFLGFDVGHDS